jgi:membrane-associated protease RseP (regulator of RpoE activity)
VAPLLDELLVAGGMFSACFMAILLAHEGGHYLAARLHREDVSLPFFLPGPPLFPLPGTFGAFIRLRAPVASRKALLDIGAAGPLAGLAVALPVLLLGLSLSAVGPIREGGLYEGNSLLYLLAKRLVHGPIPAGHDVFLHPVAMAGWWGILITALNLFPVGQLDGGHVAYALLRARAPALNRAVFGGLLGLALGLFAFRGLGQAGSWVLWIALLVLMGIEHPPMGDPAERLGPLRRAAGFACLGLFLLTFTPVPMSEDPPEGLLPAPAAVEVTAGETVP